MKHILTANADTRHFHEKSLTPGDKEKDAQTTILTFSFSLPLQVGTNNPSSSAETSFTFSQPISVESGQSISSNHSLTSSAPFSLETRHIHKNSHTAEKDANLAHNSFRFCQPVPVAAEPGCFASSSTLEANIKFSQPVSVDSDLTFSAPLSLETRHIYEHSHTADKIKEKDASLANYSFSFSQPFAAEAGSLDSVSSVEANFQFFPTCSAACFWLPWVKAEI
jgi:hypothetical protein